jgi:hypothetical protein
MSQQYDNNMKGVLFNSKNKVKETDSDMFGSITIDNVEYKLNGWKKIAQSTGNEYFSLSVYKAKGVNDGQN